MAERKERAEGRAEALSPTASPLDGVVERKKGLSLTAGPLDDGIEGIEVEPASPTTQRSTCVICFDEVDSLVSLSGGGCAHTHCSDCLKLYLKGGIAERNLASLRCPECPLPADDGVLRTVLADDSDTLATYDQLQQLATDKRAVACPSCATVCRPRSRWSNDVSCSSCSLDFCAVHGTAHAGSTCRSFEKAQKQMAKANEKFLSSSKVHPCPKCGVKIEKNEGCPHMTCTRCGYEFCWMCRGQWNTALHSGPVLFWRCPGSIYGGDSWGAGKLWSLRLLHTALTPAALALGLAGGAIGVSVVLPVMMVRGRLRRRQEEQYRLQALQAQATLRMPSPRPDDGSTLEQELQRWRQQEQDMRMHFQRQNDMDRSLAAIEEQAAAEQEQQEPEPPRYVDPYILAHRAWLKTVEVGTPVEAQYPPSGRWYLATVAEVHDERAHFTVDWADGDHQHRVHAPNHIRPDQGTSHEDWTKQWTPERVRAARRRRARST